MKLSLIIPIYNVADFLPACLDSVLAQTRQPDEVLLVDDGSTDTSGEIARQYADKYPHFHYFIKPNGGLSSARNLGLMHMSQEDGYVAFLDSDDWLEPDFVTVMLDSAVQKEADIVVCTFSDDYPNHSVVRRQAVDNGLYITDQIYADCLAAVRLSPSACNKIYRKKLFTDIEYPVGMYFEDLATTYKLFYAAEKAYFIDRPLYHYRRRDGSITRSFSWKIIDDRFQVLSDTRLFLEEKGIYQKFEKSYRLCYLAHAVSGSFFTLLKRSDNFLSDIKKLRSKVDPAIFTVYGIGTTLSVYPKQALALLAFKLPDKLLYLLYNLYFSLSKKAQDK